MAHAVPSSSAPASVLYNQCVSAIESHVEQLLQWKKWYDSRVHDTAGEAALIYRVHTARHEVLDIVRRACDDSSRFVEGAIPRDDSVGSPKHTTSQGSHVLAPASAGWNLLWTWQQPNLDLSKLLCWQRINHFPHNSQLTRKDFLKKNINRYRALRGFKHAAVFDIMPETFSLPSERVAFVQAFVHDSLQSRAGHVSEPDQSELEHRSLWILKPVALSRGRGIRVIDSLRDVHYLHDGTGSPMVAQRYIADPLLLRGYKFDLRLYVLATSLHPLECFIYREGFARLASMPYSCQPDHLRDTLRHITNTAVQQAAVMGSSTDAMAPQSESAQAEAPGNDPHASCTKISLTTLWQLLKEDGIDVDVLWRKISEVVVTTLTCTEDAIPPCSNAFELFGFDILIDRSLRPWLLEVNSSPSMECSTTLDRIIKRRMVHDTLALVDPPRFDRDRLLQLLQIRLHSGSWFPELCSLPTAGRSAAANADVVIKKRWNRELHALLKGHVPRPFGQVPAVSKVERSAGPINHPPDTSGSEQDGENTEEDSDRAVSPSNLAFEMVAPSRFYEQLVRMKRTAFSSPFA